MLEGAQICSTLECRSKNESFGTTACGVEHFVVNNACRSDLETKRQFSKYGGASAKMTEREKLVASSQALDKIQGGSEEDAHTAST